MGNRYKSTGLIDSMGEASPILTAHLHKPSRRYRPVATRAWTLTVFLVALAGCIAFFELVRVSQRSLASYDPPSRPSQLSLNRRQTVPGDPAREDELALSQTFPNADYFLAMYLPTLLAVILQVFWTIIFASTKMMEPFYQLAKPCGAEAQHTLLADYLSSGLSLDSLHSLLSGHWVMICASSVQILMGLIVTLAGESMTVKPTSYSPITGEPDEPEWFVNVPAMRALQVLMAIVFVLVFSLIVLNWNRQSGVDSDPSTIGFMARVLNHPSLIQDLRSIPAAATKKEVKQALSGNRYILADCPDDFGRLQYGVVKIRSSTESAATELKSLVSPSATPAIQPIRSQPWLILIRDIICLLVTLALFGIIVAYKNIHGAEPLNVFLNNNNTFGPRFILSGVAVLINSAWKRFEREVRTMEPYRLMSHCPSPAATTINASTTASAFTTVFVAARRRWSFVSLIAAVTVSSELLLLAIPGVPFSTAQIETVYLASTYTSLVVLGLMVLTLIALLVRRQHDPRVPRRPDTLAGVWLYLCASDMIASGGAERGSGGSTETEIGTKTESEDGKEGDGGGEDRMYWFARSPGPDGRSRWTVRGDQLRGDYKATIQ